jgi:hypothetical protein
MQYRTSNYDNWDWELGIKGFHETVEIRMGPVYACFISPLNYVRMYIYIHTFPVNMKHDALIKILFAALTYTEYSLT